jgi:hypothetical protein
MTQCLERVRYDCRMRYWIGELVGPALHGVGAHAGRACVYLRFAADGTPMTAAEIVRGIVARDTSRTTKLVVTGTDAATTWNAALAAAVRGAGFRVLLETDGSQPLAGSVDWLTIKPGAVLVDGLHADEVQVATDDSTDELALDRSAARWRCDHYFVVPRDERHVARAIALILARPRWRLSLPIAISATALRAPQQDVKPGAEAEAGAPARIDQPLRAI